MTGIASAAIMGGMALAGSVGSGLLAKSGAEAGGAAAAQASQNAAITNANIQRDQRMENRVDASPFLAAGRGGLNEIGRLMGWGSLETNGGHDLWRFSSDIGGSQAGQTFAPDASRLNALAGMYGGALPTAPTFNRLNVSDKFEADPGYQFRLSEGQKALDRSAASRGMLLSGAQVKGSTDYNQGMASQEYGNWWNRYTGGTQFNNAASQQEFTNSLGLANTQYGRGRDVMGDWMALAGLGQGSTSNLSGVNSGLSSQVGNAFVNAGIAGGQAQGAGMAQGANALASGIGSGINNAMTAAYMGGMFKGGGRSSFGPGGNPMNWTV